MAIEYPVNLRLKLKPIGQPWVRVGINQQLQVQRLQEPTIFDWNFSAVDEVCLTVEHFDKSDTDPVTAVEITDIEFFGIADPKFIWQGVYCPRYPKFWYEEQAQKPPTYIRSQSYLGWNGVYSLKFSVPVFTWIHQVQDLGWIYQ